MNYLSHFHFNHRVCGLTPRPYFAMGVALPDLWPRFSRRRRIRWSTVRAASSLAPPAADLRAGLLNHAESDRRFHSAPTFLRWQSQVRARSGHGTAHPGAAHPAVLDFLAHLAVELALDGHLLRAEPGLAREFYGVLAGCELAQVERLVAVVGAVDARGLANELEAFLARRFLECYTDRGALVAVMRFVVGLVGVRPGPPDGLLHAALEAAESVVEPAQIWKELADPDGAGRGGGVRSRLRDLRA
jgi:hypothetical protein